MSAQHTPWPFSVHPYTDLVRVLDVKPEDGEPYTAGSIAIGAGRKIVGSVDYKSITAGYPSLDTVEEAEAVAALWIAAPELLEALEWIAANYENGHLNHVDFRVRAKYLADAAIAKARGEA